MAAKIPATGRTSQSACDAFIARKITMTRTAAQTQAAMSTSVIPTLAILHLPERCTRLGGPPASADERTILYSAAARASSAIREKPRSRSSDEAASPVGRLSLTVRIDNASTSNFAASV